MELRHWVSLVFLMIFVVAIIYDKKKKWYIDWSLLSGNVGIILALLNHEDKIDSIITRIFFI